MFYEVNEYNVGNLKAGYKYIYIYIQYVHNIISGYLRAGIFTFFIILHKYTLLNFLFNTNIISFVISSSKEDCIVKTILRSSMPYVV